MNKYEQEAIDAGAIHYSPAPLRSVKGVSFTYEQLEIFANKLLSTSNAAITTLKQQLFDEQCRYEVRERELEDARKVPEGWRMVPVQMTTEMRDAGNVYTLNRSTLCRIWDDMLSAAPTGQPKEHT